MTSFPSVWLKLFGGPSISAAGVPVTGRATQRRRLALLSLLGLAPGRRATRERLMSYLWPESDAERARNSLKVSVYVLRQMLGDDALLSEGDEVRLNTDVVRIDVADFETAVQQHDHAAAVALADAPFLDGFYLDDAPDFERWVEQERTRLAAARANALETLAARGEAAHDFRTATDWWSVRAAQDPYDSRVALRTDAGARRRWQSGWRVAPRCRA